jgi:ketosteroid isomerase-like protein
MVLKGWRRKISLACLLMAAAVTAYAQAGGDQAEIRRVRAASNEAIVKRDLAAFASSLTDDFVMVSGNGAFAARAEYLKAFEDDFRSPGSVRYERIIERVELSQAGPLAAEHGHWVGRLPNRQTAYGGTYLAMWRHTDAGWKIRSELFVRLTCGKSAGCSAYQQDVK